MSIALATLILVAAASEPASSEVPVKMTLAAALDRIDQLDPTLRVRALEQTRAEVNLRRAKWNQISGTVGINVQDTLSVGGLLPTRTLGPGASDLQHQLTANLSAQINYPLYAGGAICNAIDAAEFRLAATQKDKEAIRRDLRRTAVAAYAQLVASRFQKQIAERSLERSQSLVDVAQRRRASGLGTDAEIARAKLNVLRALEDTESRRGGEDISSAVLAAVLMYDSGTRFEPSDTLEQVGNYGQALNEGERPEILSLRSQVTAAEHDRKVAFAGYLPRLELFANATYGNGQLFFLSGVPIGFGQAGDFLGVFSGNVSAGARLTWTGWDFFVTRDQVAQAEVQAAQLEARLQETERLARRERDEASARERQSKKRMEALSGGKETAEVAIRLARARYEAGTGILTEVLDAEIEAIGIESRVIQASLDYAVAHVDRLRAEGKDL